MTQIAHYIEEFREVEPSLRRREWFTTAVLEDVLGLGGDGRSARDARCRAHYVMKRWESLGWVRQVRPGFGPNRSRWELCEGAGEVAPTLSSCASSVLNLLADGRERTVGEITHALDYRVKHDTVARQLRRLRAEGLVLDVDYDDERGGVALWQHVDHIPELRGVSDAA